jgi:hypothetical protein
VGLDTKLFKKCPGIGNRASVEMAFGGLDYCPGRQGSVPMPPHAIGDYDQMSMAIIRTQHFHAVLLFGAPAYVRGHTKLPWHDLSFLVASDALR